MSKKSPTPADLARLRRRMDRVNARIVERLQERARLVRRIAALKRGLGLPASDPIREREMFDRALASAPSGFSLRELERVLRPMFAVSRALAVREMSAPRKTKGAR